MIYFMRQALAITPVCGCVFVEVRTWMTRRKRNPQIAAAECTRCGAVVAYEYRVPRR